MLILKMLDRIALGTTLAFLLCGVRIIFAQAPESNGSRQIVARSRPLADAADRLASLYGKPVTYEDPILIWGGDKEPAQNARGEIRLVQKSRSFSMPVESDRKETRILDKELLNRVVSAYHSQTDGPRFKVISSAWGIHIVPSEVRDADGKWIEAKSLLDTPIAIPLAKRTPEGHFHEICAAVTTSTGIKLQEFDPYLNGDFARVKFNMFRATVDDLERISFYWGTTSAMTAREAIFSFLEHSSNTMSWKVLCEVSATGPCFFNMWAFSFIGPDGKLQFMPDKEKTPNPSK